jgi:hypothetical protein
VKSPPQRASAKSVASFLPFPLPIPDGTGAPSPRTGGSSGNPYSPPTHRPVAALVERSGCSPFSRPGAPSGRTYRNNHSPWSSDPAHNKTICFPASLPIRVHWCPSVVVSPSPPSFPLPLCAPRWPSVGKPAFFRLSCCFLFSC